MGMFEVFRIVFGSFYVLFLPGFAWSWVFFGRDEIDWIERIALSFGLSIALVPLTVFWLNFFFEMRINLGNSFLVILVLTILAATIYFIKPRLGRKLYKTTK